MMTKNRLAVLGVIIIVAVILPYEMLWGKLFPYSPVKAGFEKHELSRIIVYVQDGTACPGCEAIAVYRSRQMGTSWYPTKAQTYAYVREGNFVPPEYFNTRKEDEVNLNVQYRTTFMYSEFACIVDYLIERYGEERFTQYVAQLLDSWQPDSVFEHVYGIDLVTCLRDFRKHVSEQL